METLKVVICIDSLLPGGAEKSLLLSLPYFRELGVQPVLVCLKRRQPNLEPLAFDLGFPPIYLTEQLSSGKWYLNLPTWISRFRNLLREERPDLIHGTLFQACLVTRLSAIGLGIPVLNSVVNLDYSPCRLDDPTLRGSKLIARIKLETFKFANRLTAPLVTHFHAVTPAVERAIHRDLRVSPERTTTVFRGRPSEFSGVPKRKELLKSLNLDPDSRIILSVGRQDYQKGQSRLIESLPLIREGHPETVLLIAGRRGTMTSQLERLVQKLGLWGCVKFLGHRTDIPDLLASCDVFCLPSVYEGAAGAVIEAMVGGRPIVASKLPEFHGILTAGQDSLLVAADSPPRLAEGICSVLDDPVMARTLAQEARRNFEQNFVLENSVKGMIGLYRKVVGAG